MPKLRFTIPSEIPAGEIVDPVQILSLYNSGRHDLICVLGPTASGKTHYAVSLARELNHLSGSPLCEIISADSRQVYRGMDIGTGKDLAEYQEIPYHLIDICPAGERYNVYRYQQDFARAWTQIRDKGGIPILCGGTGLYIEAATCGYDFDKEHPVIKAEDLPRSTYYIGTLVTREQRNARIDKRLEERMEDGMVKEVQTLLDHGVSSDALIHYGLEYKFVTLHLLGVLGFDEMKEQLRNAIHQFAKRQMTWWRGMERDGAVIHWVEP